MASLGLFLQGVVWALCSVLMDRWVALLGAKLVYISGVALLVFASIIMSVSDSVITITVMVALTGYTLAVLHVLPYTLLCLYHSNPQVRFPTTQLSIVHKTLVIYMQTCREEYSYLKSVFTPIDAVH